MVHYPINVHTGAIPKYRGHHPLSAAFLNDEPFQATTVHLMAQEVDSGDILLQDFVKVENEDTILTIRNKLSILSLNLLLMTFRQLETGTIYPKKQVGPVIWAPKRNPEDSRIDFSKSSRYLHNFIRALVDPYPNAFGYGEGKKLIRFKKSITSNFPGVVLADLGENQYVVSTIDGVILVETDVKLNIGERIS
jgi:methionyl-tRNA formyltransferase